MIDKLVRRCLIYGMIGFLGIPLSLALMIFSASPAQAAAAEKTITKPTTLTTDDLLPPTLLFQKGLKISQPYNQGQKIKLALVFDEPVLKAWAKIGVLDPTFPETITLKEEETTTWILTTPILTGELNEGQQNLFIYAQDKVGNTAQFTFEISLKKTENLSLKAAVGEEQLYLAWEPIKNTAQYLVTWNIQGEDVVQIKVLEGETTAVLVDGLVPGTFYEVQVSSVNLAGAMMESKKMTVKTSGIPPPKEVAGESISRPSQISRSRQITPAIGEGVSTRAPKISQVPQEEVTPPQKEVSPKPEPTPSQSPQETTEQGGWNRLLVALAILVIAAGAAIGGYYGYEWWSGRSEKEEPPKPKSSSRW